MAADGRYHSLIYTYFSQGRYELCQKLIDLQGENDFTVSIQAKMLRTQGKIKESLQLLTNHTKSSTLIQPQSTWLDIGKTLISAGKIKRAQKILSKLPSSPEVLHYLAICAVKIDPGSPKAEQIFTKVLELNPKAELSYRELTRYYIKCNRANDAVTVLRQGYQNCPESLEIGTSYGLLLCEAGSFELAEQILTPMVEIDPENLRATLAAGVCSQLNTKAHLATRHDKIKLSNLNNLHFFKFYKKIYKYAAESPALWNNIGLALLDSDAWAALFCLKRALFLSPLDVSILFNVGLACYHLKQYVYAAGVFQTARQLQEVSKMPRSSPIALQTLMMFGMSLWRVNDLKNARRAFQEALQAQIKGNKAKDPWIYTNFALFELFEGDTKETAWKIIAHYFGDQQGPANDDVSLESLRKMVTVLKN